jgi:hypothetical protein
MIVAMTMMVHGPAVAQEQVTATQPQASVQGQVSQPLSDDELEQLVARIALYPDELVAVVCAASLFPLQIVEAQRFLEKRARDKSLQPKDSWDGSVISLLNYPTIVEMMSNDLDWTQALGDALANQQKDVLMAIQQLRDEAVAKDIIKSDTKIRVQSSGDNIVIQSVDPETIYVPQYDPQMLYVANYPPQPISYYDDAYPSYLYPAATFFAGAVTGAVWGAMVDWDDWGVWGGRWGGDIDIDCNNCLNNINGKVKWNDIDWTKVDRSKINIDRDQLAKIDRSSIKNEIRSNEAGSIGRKANDLRNDRRGNMADRTERARDVRQNASKLGAAKKASDAQAAKPKARQQPAGKGKAAANRSSGKKAAASRPSGKKKAGARVDNRPRKPSAIGNAGRGKAAQVSSNRGRQSMGGGSRGGGHVRKPPPRGGGMGGGGRGGGRRR